jgi:hypothetical protein
MPGLQGSNTKSHHSVSMDEIKQESEKHGHTVRNILNIRHRYTKEPLPLFFIDLEPKENSKSVYEIKYLCNTKITKPQERKMTLCSAQDVSATSIQKHIAQDRILVLKAEANTTQPCVKRIQILLQNVPYAKETTWLIAKVATYIKTYKKQEAKQQFNQDKTLLNDITETLTSTIVTNFLL